MSDETVATSGRLLKEPVAGSSASRLGPLAQGPFQVDFVTPDLDRAVASLNDEVGVDRFFVIRDAPVTDQTLRGQPCDARQVVQLGADFLEPFERIRRQEF